jgi:2-polyprenyl-6-methoxyphenol hydroxylase-like FAD-dependent oxidoreductase
MKIAIAGAGYVGLVTGVCLADFGHDVVCIDKDQRKIEALERGEVRTGPCRAGKGQCERRAIVLHHRYQDGGAIG